LEEKYLYEPFNISTILMELISHHDVSIIAKLFLCFHFCGLGIILRPRGKRGDLRENPM
jgi:hypothetical protein